MVAWSRLPCDTVRLYSKTTVYGKTITMPANPVYLGTGMHHNLSLPANYDMNYCMDGIAKPQDQPTSPPVHQPRAPERIAITKAASAQYHDMHRRPIRGTIQSAVTEMWQPIRSDG